MSDPATAVLVLTVVTAGVSAYSSIQQGRAMASAEEERQRQLQKQMEGQQITMRDQLNERRREIAVELGEQAAMGAQSGFDPFAAGSNFLAIREETERVGQVDAQRIRLMNLNEMQNQSTALTQSRLAEDQFKTQGYLKALTAVGEGATQAYSLRSPKKLSTGGGFTGSAVHAGFTR